MRFLILKVLIVMSLVTVQAVAQDTKLQQVLLPIDVNQVPKWNAPYEYRIASFVQDEAENGSGALILLLSQDQRKVFINVNGVTTELNSVQKNISLSCRDGDIRQNVYSNGQVRLLLKLKLHADKQYCWGGGLVSVYVEKHTHRYLVKGATAL